MQKNEAPKRSIAPRTDSFVAPVCPTVTSKFRQEISRRHLNARESYTKIALAVKQRTKQR